MSNIEIQSNRRRSLLIFDAVFGGNEKFSQRGVVDLPAGTILARNRANMALAPYDPAGSVDNRLTIPVAILTENTTLVNGEATVRPLLTGRVRAGDLSVFGSQTAEIDGFTRDLLKDTGILALSTTQLSELDNGATPTEA